LTDAPEQEIRSLNYLLSELSRWEEDGIVEHEQASGLRESYEERREGLRAQLAASRKRTRTVAPPSAEVKTPAPDELSTPQPPPDASYPARQFAPDPQSFFPPPVAPLPTGLPFRTPKPSTPRRPLLETLSDPYTIRLLLYAGAAMLVVGVVIGLKDILYLKLQEPVVQATLLVIGTIAVTVSGWFAILRTRLLLTGRALTLTGSLLVPVNFWFLVRSGLIENSGRAWLVCAFCAALYALTAAFLRERLYVYLASVAAIATAWTIIYRIEHEAFGLYALVLMAASLVFLHLSRLFPAGRGDGQLSIDDEQASVADKQSAIGNRQSSLIARLSYELWGPPLVRVALIGATLSALLYMPLRFGSSGTLADGIFRLRGNDYDSSVAMLLFAAAAYIAWFTGRYIYPARRAFLYTASALALFWTEFLAADGLRLSGSAQLLLLASSALIVALAARVMKNGTLALALHRASLIVSVALASIAYAVISTSPAYTLMQSAILAFLAATYAVASAPRFSEKVAAETLAHAAALSASIAFLIALTSLSLQSETLFYAACALWPFALYAIARLARHLRRELQLSVPFMRIADAEFVLLLIFAGSVALFLDQAPEDGSLRVGQLRGAMFCVLVGAVIYGAVRCWRDRSVFGAALMSVALLILVAATGDALKYFGALPVAWPVATAVILAAFLLRTTADRLLKSDRARAAGDISSLASFATRLSRADMIRLVADCAVVACASLWLTNALYHLDEGGMSASVVIFLALLYWSERAARLHQSWLVYLSTAHAGALCFALLVALGVERQWFATVFVLALFPLFFVTWRYAGKERGIDWLAQPARVSANLVLALATVTSFVQALSLLRVGEPLLLAPCVALGTVALLSLGASLWAQNPARVGYFRCGLLALIIAFALAALRAGFDPLGDMEIYTMPVALLLLVVAYFFARRQRDEYASDTSLLLWAGSLLLAGPLLMHALQYRLFLDVPAPWRDLALLFASLALLVFGILGRLRAPVLVGAASLALELSALALTTVDWLQIPLKVYLISTGALILLIWGLLEFRREQLLLMRRRLNERREYARERFGEWR
jgi:hypothetical protein